MLKESLDSLELVCLKAKELLEVAAQLALPALLVVLLMVVPY